MAAITVSLTLARKQVDPKQVGLNRVALLHGPPGTGGDIGVTMITIVITTITSIIMIIPAILLPTPGKTSLCQSLANKLAIRLTGQGGDFTKVTSCSCSCSFLCSCSCSCSFSCSYPCSFSFCCSCSLNFLQARVVEALLMASPSGLLTALVGLYLIKGQGR